MDKKHAGQAADANIDTSYDLIQDDVTAQDRYVDGRGNGRFESAEVELIRAVLEDAVACTLKPKWSRESAAALDWILNEEANHFCSFESICELLGLEPAYVRRGILAKVAAEHSFPGRAEARGNHYTNRTRVAA